MREKLWFWLDNGFWVLAAFPQWSEPRAVTKGPHEHLLASYFAIDSWSPNKRYISILETDLNGRLPEQKQRKHLRAANPDEFAVFRWRRAMEVLYPSPRATVAETH